MDIILNEDNFFESLPLELLNHIIKNSTLDLNDIFNFLWVCKYTYTYLKLEEVTIRQIKRFINHSYSNYIKHFNNDYGALERYYKTEEINRMVLSYKEVIELLQNYRKRENYVFKQNQEPEKMEFGIFVLKEYLRLRPKSSDTNRIRITVFFCIALIAGLIITALYFSRDHNNIAAFVLLLFFAQFNFVLLIMVPIIWITCPACQRLEIHYKDSLQEKSMKLIETSPIKKCRYPNP